MCGDVAKKEVDSRPISIPNHYAGGNCTRRSKNRPRTGAQPPLRGLFCSLSESRPRELIDNELVGCEFEDVRHRKQLRQFLEQFSDRVGSTTPWASQDWANTKAAYRFFGNKRISEASILAGHFGSTRERFAGTGKSMALIWNDPVNLCTFVGLFLSLLLPLFEDRASGSRGSFGRRLISLIFGERYVKHRFGSSGPCRR